MGQDRKKKVPEKLLGAVGWKASKLCKRRCSSSKQPDSETLLNPLVTGENTECSYPKRNASQAFVHRNRYHQTLDNTSIFQKLKKKYWESRRRETRDIARTPNGSHTARKEKKVGSWTDKPVRRLSYGNVNVSCGICTFLKTLPSGTPLRPTRKLGENCKKAPPWCKSLGAGPCCKQYSDFSLAHVLHRKKTQSPDRRPSKWVGWWCAIAVGWREQGHHDEPPRPVSCPSREQKCYLLGIWH